MVHYGGRSEPEEEPDFDGVMFYNHKGEKDRAIADYRAALAKNPSEEDREEIEEAFHLLGADN